MTRVKPGQRKRAKAPKVRTGCQTCKCDGYAAQAASPSSRAMPLSSCPLPPPSQDELRAGQMFRERTLAHVSEFFVEELWTTRILRIAHAEPGIWHALISLSSYHELFLNPVDPGGGQGAVDRHNLGIYALHHHNMAIKAALDIQRTPKHPLSHLLSCVVFVTIEMIRGEIIAAIRLLKHGHRVLHEYRSQRTGGQVLMGSEDGLIVSLVEAFFAKLTHHATCVAHLTGVTIY
ncbi:C6 zinc finger domain protein [Metarhizium album ARSEF 1941]|uniref:C6 zinc finger domain protein n=1 Tax=Metarhizium album (strain ARSEF 1941) TaxID=1081103 RepID=A0A0B2WVR3_METAS|nr:C6 zinc finger domain protein [Metarhizium album ARSEF 1941]KHO00222.1 C6 zinc finger domain protein [Metarhizium album ARSEF 1941]